VRIGIDGACWANHRGYGRFTRELLRAVVELEGPDELVFFLDAAARDAFDLAGASRVEVVDVAQRVAPTQAAAADGHRSPTDMLRFARAVRRSRVDVFLSPTVYTYFPLPPRLPAVVGIHDTIAERHPELTLPTTRARLFWNAKVRLALRQARLVMTVSEFSAREIADVLRVPPDRIRVVGEAPAPVFRPATPEAVAAAAARLGIPPDESWLVYVGGFGPHKNVDTVVRAHAEAAARAPTRLHLLLVGALDDAFLTDRSPIDAAIAAAGTGDRVHWPGFVPDEDLRDLLTGAVALLLPSEREGFGLPAVEAAACGTPVVATTRSPLPDLLAGGGIFVEPRDEPALRDAVVRLTTEPALRDQLGEQARERASGLRWDRAAEAALAVLHEAAR
jgi:glycosyltransferase involved in cell wall biosynthesis